MLAETELSERDFANIGRNHTTLRFAYKLLGELRPIVYGDDETTKLVQEAYEAVSKAFYSSVKFHEKVGLLHQNKIHEDA